MATIHEHADEISQTLGRRLRAMRESREWTLETLAERTGLSKAYLSRLECGDRQPSMVALHSLATALGLSIAALFEQPDDSADAVIIRGGSIAPISANGLTYVPLSSSTKPFNLQPIEVTIPADRPGDQTFQHDGEEWLIVTAGSVRLSIDGKEHVLNRGDAAHFDARLPHRLDALKGDEARVVLVACSIPIALNPRRQQARPVAGLVG